MGLETATYITDLVSTNPLGTDSKAQGDNHIRLLKEVLKTQFPSLGSAAVTATAAEINLLAGGIFDIIYPYTSKEFINIWSNWKIYKAKEFKFNYRTLQSEQAALKKLSNDSDNESHAIESIELAMANGWKGIYPQKIINNGKQNNKNGLSYSTEFQEELARKIQS